MDYSHQKHYFETAYNTGSDHWSKVVFDKKGSDIINKLEPGAMILDLGSGRGRFPFELVAHGYKVIGLDYITSIVEKNNEEVKNRGIEKSIRFLEGDVLDIPLTDGSFDAVCDVGLLQHIHPEDWTTYREQVSRVLKKDGYFFLTVFSKETTTFLNWHPKREPFGTYEREGVEYHFFSNEELSLLFESDFNVVSSRIEHSKVHSDDVAYAVLLLQKK